MQAWRLSVGSPALWVKVAGLSLPTPPPCGVTSSQPSLGRPRPSAVCTGGGVGTAVAPRMQAPHDAHVSLQAPTVTIEGFLQALSLAVDKQFEDRKKLSSRA